MNSIARKTILLIFCFLEFFYLSSAQSIQMKEIEQNIKDVYGGYNDNKKFKKQVLDLNGDKKQDLIYTYICGEPNCIEVYFNTGMGYKQQISEFYSFHKIIKEGDKVLLSLLLYSCCGESPYISSRLYSFDGKEARLSENYVITNTEYVVDTTLLRPKTYCKQPYFVETTIDNYNVRFRPSLERLSNKEAELFTYGCEHGTNIIARLKIGCQIKVLAESTDKERTWLFVEIEHDALSGECNPIVFEFEDQKLRGWVSGKFMEKKGK